MLPLLTFWRFIAAAYPLLLVLQLAMSLSACAVPFIPLPIQSADEEPFQAEQLAFLKIGETSKDEVATAMTDYALETEELDAGEKLTPMKFQNGNWWLYSQSWNDARWAFFSYGLLITDTGVVRLRFLLINFDENDIVSHYELSLAQGNGCNQSGICRQGSHFGLLARSNDDQAAKQFDAHDEQCGVYLYTKWNFLLPVELNGNRVNAILDNGKFLYWQLDEGVHQLNTLPMDTSEQKSIEFTCVAGASYFFELKSKRSGTFGHKSWIDIEQRDPVDGRQAIGNRRLLLSITAPSD